MTTDCIIDANWRETPNCEERKNGCKPDMLVMHYTAMESAEAAIGWLVNPVAGVSAHYLIDEAGRITQMAAEASRAWHAGLSHWAGEDDINSRSIGIEIHNPGPEMGYPDFPDAQMTAVEILSTEIIGRHAIAPARVLAHSDVAPRRKQDPGEKFDWGRLHRAGIGHWVEPEPIGDDVGLGLGDKSDEVRALQRMLHDYGYLVGTSGRYSHETKAVVTAFQRHFRPAGVTGRADRSTVVTLERLIGAL